MAARISYDLTLREDQGQRREKKDGPASPCLGRLAASVACTSSDASFPLRPSWDSPGDRGRFARVRAALEASPVDPYPEADGEAALPSRVEARGEPVLIGRPFAANRAPLRLPPYPVAELGRVLGDRPRHGLAEAVQRTEAGDGLRRRRKAAVRHHPPEAVPFRAVPTVGRGAPRGRHGPSGPDHRNGFAAGRRDGRHHPPHRGSHFRMHKLTNVSEQTRQGSGPRSATHSVPAAAHTQRRRASSRQPSSVDVRGSRHEEPA
jgi:hypothetical protein